MDKAHKDELIVRRNMVQHARAFLANEAMMQFTARNLVAP